MLLLASVIVAFASAATLAGQPTPLTASLLTAVAVALGVIASRNATADGAVSRICYLTATIAYLVALPWWHQILLPQYAVAPAPIAWMMPLLYFAILPLAFALLPLVSRISYATDAYRWARYGSRWREM